MGFHRDYNAFWGFISNKMNQAKQNPRQEVWVLFENLQNSKWKYAIEELVVERSFLLNQGSEILVKEDILFIL